MSGKLYNKPAGPIIVGPDAAGPALARVAREGRNGRMVYVCSWCVRPETSPELHSALRDFENISHGVCTPCMREAMGEMTQGGAL